MQVQIIFFFCCFFLTITNPMLWDQYNFLGGSSCICCFPIWRTPLSQVREFSFLLMWAFDGSPCLFCPRTINVISRTAAMSNICQWEKYILKEVIGLLLICKMLPKCLKSKFTVFNVSSCVQDFKGTKMNNYLTSSLMVIIYERN